MISFKNYEQLINKIYQEKQEHVFTYWETLNNTEKEFLLKQLNEVDFDLLKKLYTQANNQNLEALNFEPAPYQHLPTSNEEQNKFNKARQEGEKHIRAGKVAAFMVAGGQGSRLGFDGPKGKYPVSAIKKKTLFQLHAEKILASQIKYSVTIPWVIMTSETNNDETIHFFEENNFFGLDDKNVIFFMQKMIPSIDRQGKLILKDKKTLFRNPDGHGGSLTALRTSGTLGKLESLGIEIISYFQVDNPLTKIIDPIFIGFHLLNNAQISSKALKKAYPEEKVGNFVRYNDQKIGVVEYSDMTEELIFQKDEKEEIAFSAGSIAIHLFDLHFIKKITESNSSLSLPFHVAKKEIKGLNNGEIKNIPGYKFEKFVFDALPLADENFILETAREEEFAPVKNKTGVDSAESCQQLMHDLYKSWLLEKNIKIPTCVEKIEISPLEAIEAEDLAQITIPENKNVYIG